MSFLWSANPVAPTAEITASCPLKDSCRSLLEKSDLRTVTPAGNVASLEERVKTVTLKSLDSRRPERIILPMLPLACLQLVWVYTVWTAR